MDGLRDHEPSGATEGRDDHPDADASKGADAASLLPEMYEQLRAMARQWFTHEPADHTLQATALVHEAYLRLAESEGRPWRDRHHFYVLATRAMRRVLVDHARRRHAAKRGGGWRRIELRDHGAALGIMEADILALDEALEKLRVLNESHARIAELRFLGGLSVDETATALGMAPRTVRLHWRIARAWLLSELRKGESP